MAALGRRRDAGAYPRPDAGRLADRILQLARWVFYINVPVGIVATLGMMAFLPDTPKDRSRPLDIFGFAMLSIAIGALQLMLDRGETKDWFGSTEIMIEAAVAGLSLYLFLVQMFTTQHPFLQPGMFKDRNYSTALVFMFVMGIILLATTGPATALPAKPHGLSGR